MKSDHSSQAPKKILILSWELFPLFLGGLGILARDIVKELSKQGVEVTVVLPYIPKDLEVPQGISLERLVKKHLKKKQPINDLDFDLQVFNTSKKAQVKTWPQLFVNKKGVDRVAFKLYPNNTPAISKAFAWAVKDYLEQNNHQFDAIIGMDWQTIPTCLLLKDKEVNIPFFFHMNSIEVDRSPNVSTHTHVQRAIIELEKKGMQAAAKVFCVSNVTKKSIIKYCEVPAKDIVVVNNDITFVPDTKGYKELDKGKNILFVGRIFPQKGLEFLLDTAQKVISMDPQIKFLIGGDGMMIPQVVTSIAERELEKNVLLTGWVSSSVKKQLYRSGDLFVMPSPSEPFGLTALEAIRSGVPVIASKNCGFLDVVPSTPTFEYFDTHQFAEMIMYYLNDHRSWSELLKTQQKELSKHRWSDQIAKIIKQI